MASDQSSDLFSNLLALVWAHYQSRLDELDDRSIAAFVAEGDPTSAVRDELRRHVRQLAKILESQFEHEDRLQAADAEDDGSHPRIRGAGDFSNSSNGEDANAEAPSGQITRDFQSADAAREEEAADEVILAVGTNFGDRYIIEREIGKGAFGRVYRARDGRLGRSVALKVISSRRNQALDNAPFIEEASVAASLEKHPNVVQVFDAGQFDGLLYISMEFVEGTSLYDDLDEYTLRKNLPPTVTTRGGRGNQADPAKRRQAPSNRPSAGALDRIVRLIEGVAKGLVHIHTPIAARNNAQIVHRDLKPANVMIDTDGTAQITDFGLAKVVGSASPSEPGVPAGLPRLNTQSSSQYIVGTIAYMAPEQIEGTQRIDCRADLYSLGVIAYQLLTGRLPLEVPQTDSLRRDPFRQLRAYRGLLHTLPKSPRDVNPIVDPELDAIVQRLLKRRREDRYENASLLLEDLNRRAKGFPLDPFTQRTGLIDRAAKFVRRSTNKWSISIAVSLSIAVAAWGVVYYLTAVTLPGQEKAFSQLGSDFSHAKAELQSASERDRAKKETDDNELQKREFAAAESALREGRSDHAIDSLAKVPMTRRDWSWRFLNRRTQLLPRPYSTMGMHDWGVSAALVSSDGRMVITAGHDGRLLLYKDILNEAPPTPQGRPAFPPPKVLQDGQWWEDHRSWRHSLFDPSSKVIDSPPADPSLTSYVQLTWMEDGKRMVGVTCSHDRTAKKFHGAAVVWSFPEGMQETAYKHDRLLSAAAGSQDGRYLLFGDDVGTLIFQDRTTGKTRRQALAPHAVARILFLSPGHWLVAQSNGTISLFQLELGEAVAQLPTVEHLRDVAMASDGKLLAVAGRDIHLYTFDRSSRQLAYLATYARLQADSELSSQFHAVTLDTQCRHMFAADDLGRVAGWRIGEERPFFVQRDQVRNDRFHNECFQRLPPSFQRKVSALVVLPDGRTLLTAGLDGGLRRWTPINQTNIRQLDVAAGSLVRCSPVAADHYWVADRSGRLSLWDLRHARQLFSQPVHHEPCVGLELSRDGRLAITAAGTRLRVWAVEGTRVEPTAQAEYVHERPIRRIALSPNGRLAAIYDHRDHVALWDIASKKLRGKASLYHEILSPTFAGPMGFSPDSSKLAIGGPGNAFSVFDTNAFDSPPDRPSLVAGRGATSITWHPRLPNLLVAGDAEGRLKTHSRSQSDADAPFLFTGYPASSPVVGLAFSPDGTNLAALTADAKVWLFTPRWTGLIYRLSTPDLSPVSIEFDRDGDRLVVAHQNGRITVCETGTSAMPPTMSETWSSHTLLNGPSARDIRVRPEGIHVDSRGVFQILFARLTADGTNRAGREIVVGSLRGTSFREQRIPHEDTSKLNQRTLADSLGRSLTLVPTSRGLSVLARFPTEGFRGRLDEILVDQSVQSPARAIGNPGNWGFEPLVIGDGPLGLSVVHFAHFGTGYLLMTQATESGSETDYVGREGDGLSATGKRGSDGSAHLVFKPSRWGGDPSPLTYLRVSPDNSTVEREVVDPVNGANSWSIEFGSDGQPAVLYTRLSEDYRRQTIVSRQTARRWLATVVVEGNADSQQALSNVARDPAGRLSFAYADERHRIHWVAETENGWKSSVIGQTDEQGAGRLSRLIAAVDVDGFPVILAVCRDESNGWLRVFRPARRPR